MIYVLLGLLITLVLVPVSWVSALIATVFFTLFVVYAVRVIREEARAR